MRVRNIHMPERNVLKRTLSSSSIVTPDLKLVNVFRYVTTDDLVIANPTNLEDGIYIRIEVQSVAGKDVNFGSMYNVNGSVIGDGGHSDDTLIIYDGWYNEDSEIFNIAAVIGGGSVETLRGGITTKDGRFITTKDGRRIIRK